MIPVFIFSAPRSGSTFLLRLLSAHAGVHGLGETWLLLPHLYSTRMTGVRAEYSQSAAAYGIQRFVNEQLPGGKATYRQALRAMAMKIYESASPADTTHVIDKNPRYSLIAEEIIDTFPEARFIFLWRNPLSVIGSAFEMYGRWPMSVHTNYVDYHEGVDRSIKAIAKHQKKVMVLRYEELVTDPRTTLNRLCDYLDLEPQEESLKDFTKVQFGDAGGDVAGVARYDSISQASLERYQQSLCNPLRRRLAKAYLRWLGKERLAVMGYDGDELRHALDRAKGWTRHLPGDARRLAVGRLSVAVKQRLFGWSNTPHPGSPRI